MAGIYLHIPFCRQACVYCDFHFSTLSNHRDAMPAALVKEAEIRQVYLGTNKLDTIYFGGGTPSILKPDVLQGILDGLKQFFHWDEKAEITIEANPDDLDEDYLKHLSQTEVNRLSIGIQSFRDPDLKFMNRAHNATEARHSLEWSKKFGFDNLTLDLIYGLPEQSGEDWLWQLEQLSAYEIPHFSAYALTVEDKTVLDQWVKKEKVKVDEVNAAEQFKILQAFASENAYEHYELSNFAKSGFQAKHNSAYWLGRPYLGLGPSAHSYNGRARHWNVSNNALYLKGLEKMELAIEEEVLSEKDRFNEWLMIGLRLGQGLDLKGLKDFSPAFETHFWKEAERLMNTSRLIRAEDHLKIPANQRFYSDGIASEMFYIAE